MCQAIPRKVLSVEGDRVEVLVDEAAAWVNGFGIAGLRPGDYVVVYAGAIVQQVSEEEAHEILRFLEEMEALFETEPEFPGKLVAR